MRPAFRTALTELTGVTHPIVQTGMGWVAGPRLVSATANAGALGILASATMTLAELERAIVEVRERTTQPFGVNLRADAGDADKRVQLLIEYGVKVASFALAPRPEQIARLKEHGVVVMPSVGAARHAQKVAAWGADLVMVQGGEGGGHTGQVPTTLLLPSVLDAVDIPVVAAGGFYDGRGLAAALSYGAAGIGMGTRFLLTSDSAVPERIRREYLGFGLDGTVVTSKADGMPHRLLRTRFVNGLDRENRLTGLFRTARRTAQFKRMAQLSWPALLRDGLAMRKAGDRSWAQLVLAANTPMLLRAGLVEGDTDAGMLASGQVVGLIDDLPSCAELVDRIVSDAVSQLSRAQATISPTKHLFGSVSPSDPEDE
ncbi:NAD(P)H-dependent flavin oxidoreductase YrpB (nitropropane dioxygenase family) [Asanoa ferruginea]|uniref:NAD(P)H-dependent flavin oxidoreductase YrpB (Nitropropane dioxygenase family) n=1 Tax=Asanoa ferruginea TaxID=53367 RepID=A0A3D9ZN45_9ACTN|nr:nitronate monooxygenase [Asanoa ferruginea]REF98289.1 NAD(P)H-dependent flavin oxidoreductase YrpB (nitropropane dioxygenase family) [Asanoa ferruginea]GIF52025.1 2-nitropropane dioxygenase [Asanoa ferruginea]